ncbi:MAG TPA: Wzz/FepE/Etk N-terminal domain-containing protein, partial [Chryseolinea sp.]|nr:Wzz/FepE/Etk N-terminal domain-containing protein [Chryseolinea sp.]
MSSKDIQAETDYVDVKEMLSKYTRYWYMFMLSIVLCAALAYAYLYLATPQYKISSSLLLKNEESD